MVGPLELFYSWQAILVTVAAVGVTALLKTILDLRMGRPKRRASLVVNHLILPMAPIFIGGVFAVLVPVYPEFLSAYVAKNITGWRVWLVYAAWGAACGQFADYGFTKVKDTLAGMQDHRQRRNSIPPSSGDG